MASPQIASGPGESRVLPNMNCEVWAVRVVGLLRISALSMPRVLKAFADFLGLLGAVDGQAISGAEAGV